jgi:glutamine amidotransferase
MSDNKFKNIKVGIIDLKINNIHSVYQAFKAVGFKTEIVKKNFDYNLIILPGVGSFGSGMKIIKKKNIEEKLRKFLENKQNYLYGICLGMQLLLNKSYEFNEYTGMGLVKGIVKKIKKNKDNRVPNIGWHQLKYINKNQFIGKELKNNKFYFVHSYYCELEKQESMDSYIKLGKQKICSSLKHENIIATQFHPEKSGLSGMELIKNIGKFFT